MSSRELTEWMAFDRVKAEEAERRRAAETGHTGLAGGL